MEELSRKPKVAIIVGSNRPTRICLEIAQWMQHAMQHPNLQIDLIDLAEINLPFLDEPEIPAHGNYQQEHTKLWSQKISGYDGFVLLFPQYNWGYPAVLKNALDYLYTEWAGKPVSTMCYGNHGGFQALLAIRLVTQGLHMQTMTANVPINLTDDMFDEHGLFKDSNTALEPSRLAAELVSQEFSGLLGPKSDI